MAEIKSTGISAGPPAAPLRETRLRVSSLRPVQNGRTEDRPAAGPQPGPAGDAAQLIADFAAPPPQIAGWLTDTRLAGILQAASETLAPSGQTENVEDRYAASVIETHLAAKRRLSSVTNAMLKA